MDLLDDNSLEYNFTLTLNLFGSTRSNVLHNTKCQVPFQYNDATFEW